MLKVKYWLAKNIYKFVYSRPINFQNIRSDDKAGKRSNNISIRKILSFLSCVYRVYFMIIAFLKNLHAKSNTHQFVHSGRISVYFGVLEFSPKSLILFVSFSTYRVI